MKKIFCGSERYVIIFLFIILAFWGQQVIAETPPADDFLELSLEDLGDITIATKTSRSSSEIPSTVFVYTQEQIRQHGWNSLAELMQDVPGVDVINKGGRGTTLSVRGVGDLSFHGNKTVVMIDGHNTSISSKNSPGYSGFMNQYDIFNAKRIEIQIGPGGTLHGANAFGIVINIITLSPEDINGVEADFIYGSQGEYIPSIRFGGRNENLGFFQSLTLWEQDDSELAEINISKNPDGTLIKYDNSTFEEQTSSNFDLHGYIDYDDTLRIGYRYSRVDGGRGTSLVSFEKGSLKIDQPMLYLDFSTGLSDRITYTLSTHYKKTRTDKTQNYFINTTNNIYTPYNTVGSLASKSDSFVMDNQFTFFQNGELTWVGGLYLEASDQSIRNVTIKRNTTDKNQRPDVSYNSDENFDNYAGYIQMEWMPDNNFYLVTGLRYVDSQKQYDSELIPRLGLSYILSDSWTAKFNYQKGYRPPSVDEGQPAPRVAPNTTLDSETIDSYELSLVGKPHAQIGLRATWFVSSISDLIARTAYVGDDFDSIDNNVGKIDVNGLELEFNYDVNDKLRIESTATYTDSVDKETDERIRTVIPYKLNLSFIASPAANWQLAWDNYFRWNPTTDTENALYEGDDAEDWILSNLTVSNERSFNVKGLRLSMSIRNLLNEKYGHVDPRSSVITRSNGTQGAPFVTSYHPQETINVLFGVHYRFQ